MKLALFILAVALAQPTVDGSIITSGTSTPWDCRADNPSGRLEERIPGKQWSWLCTSGSLVRCDSPGREPRDIAYPECNAVLGNEPTRTITVKLLDRQHVGIEWRRLTDSGTQLIASRQIGPGEARIVASRSSRILRFTAPETAPVSMVLQASPDDSELTVPPAEAGSELLWFTKFGPGTPEQLRLTGKAPTTLTIDAASPITRKSLFPGSYSATVLYSSGLPSEEVQFMLDSARSTELSREHFGPRSELELVLEPGAKDLAPQTLELYGLTTNGSSTQRRLVWRSPNISIDSSWRIDGLRAGEYEATLAGDAPIARVVVDVPENQRTQAILQKPTVDVSGTITFGTKPAPDGTRVHFEFDRQRFTTTTGRDGSYSVSLAGPGTYTARIEVAKYLWTWTDKVAVVSGKNRFDWKVPGGSIALRLRREDGRPIDELVQLQCSGGSFHSAGPVMREELDRPLLLVGLPLGEVTCKADTTSGLISNELLVRLSSSTPNVESTLTLRMLAGTLELRSASGGHISGAAVIVGNTKLDEEPEGSGHYRILRVAPGSGMLFQAGGYLPLCKVLRDSDFPVLRVTLQAAGNSPFSIRLTPQANRPIGTLFGVPGSECPVSLFAFEPRLRNISPTTSEFTLMLPPGTYQYQPYSLYPLQTFSVPGPPLELTRPK